MPVLVYKFINCWMDRVHWRGLFIARDHYAKERPGAARWRDRNNNYLASLLFLKLEKPSPRSSQLHEVRGVKGFFVLQGSPYTLTPPVGAQEHASLFLPAAAARPHAPPRKTRIWLRGRIAAAGAEEKWSINHARFTLRGRYFTFSVRGCPPPVHQGVRSV